MENDQIDNSPPPPDLPSSKPAPTRPLLEWYTEKKVPRDYLCIAVTSCGFDAQQEPGTIEETFLTEQQFDSIIASAKGIVNEIRTKASGSKAGRRGRPRVLAHSKFLLAIIVNKPTKSELDAFSIQMSDESLPPQASNDLMIEFLNTHMLWPLQGSRELEYLLVEYPVAYARVFPQLLMTMTGGDGDLVKRVG